MTLRSLRIEAAIRVPSSTLINGAGTVREDDVSPNASIDNAGPALPSGCQVPWPARSASVSVPRSSVPAG